MDSFSSPSSGSSPNFSKEDLMDQLKVQLAQAYAEEFLEVTITLVCICRLYLCCDEAQVLPPPRTTKWKYNKILEKADNEPWAENALTSASPNLVVALVAVRAVASPGVWIVILRPLVSLAKHSSTNSTESYVELLETQFE